MNRYFRANVAEMSGYTPGLQPRELGWVKLNTNENPYPPSPRVVEAVRIASGELRKYPDPTGEAFRRAAADVLGVRPEEILCGNGSDDILTILFRTFCEASDTVLTLYPSYSLYPVLARIQGCGHEAVEYPEDYSLPLDVFRRRAKMIIVANPNAPTGTTIPVGDIAALASGFDGMVVIDEAYVDFGGESAVPLVRRHENLVVTRSLSKSYSLAGLRFGFAVATAEVIAGMAKVKDSYNVDRLAIAGAAAAMRDQEYFRANVERVKATRARLTAGLESLGLAVLPSSANFVLARCASRAAALGLYEELVKRKILVRHFDHRRVSDCLRISVGTDEEVGLLLGALAEIMARA